MVYRWGINYKTSIFEYSTETPERARKRLHATSYVDGTIQKRPRTQENNADKGCIYELGIQG